MIFPQNLITLHVWWPDLHSGRWRGCWQSHRWRLLPSQWPQFKIALQQLWEWNHWILPTRPRDNFQPCNQIMIFSWQGTRVIYLSFYKINRRQIEQIVLCTPSCKIVDFPLIWTLRAVYNAADDAGAVRRLHYRVLLTSGSHAVMGVQCRTWGGLSRRVELPVNL